MSLMSTCRLFWQWKVLCVLQVSELRVLGLSAEAHVTPVVQLSFLDGPNIVALSADSRGRVMHHNVTSYLSFTSYMLPGVRILVSSENLLTISLIYPCKTQRPVHGIPRL